MQQEEYVAAVRRHTAALLDAAARADRTAVIAACPAWTVPDLVWHVAEVQHLWGSVVAERMQDLAGYVRPARPSSDEELFAVAAAGADRLVEALTAVDPATPVFTWSSQRDIGFVVRRMAHEAAVHRVDAERAAGDDDGGDPDLAADGIDELLHVFLPRAVEGAPPLDGTVHLHCTDVAGEWLLGIGDDGAPVVRREHAKGDAAIRGPAHDLLMVLWRRDPLDAVEVIGDSGVAERFVGRTDLG